MNDSTVLTFHESDQLSLQAFGQKLERFLTVEHEFVDDSLVIALKAPFGSGKTWFLSMWKNDLETRHQSTSSVPIPIMLNAWEDDYCGDPLLSIITGLMNGLSTPESKADKQSLREAAKDVAWFVTGLANGVASKIAGFDPIAAGKFAKEKKDDRELGKPDFVALFEEKTKAVRTLKTELKKIFGSEAPKAIVFCGRT